LTTLETMGPQHGFGIARRIEQTSGDKLSLNCGTQATESTLQLASDTISG
jgi:hypothetical protein